MKYHNRRRLYGPKFTVGDTIGCCINFCDHSIFYTRNGELLDVAFPEILIDESSKDDIYPMVGLYSPGDHIRVNFGREPFVFDIAQYVQSIFTKSVETDYSDILGIN